jgi:hypothetical protein
MVVETFLGNAFAPTIALDLLDMILVLLTVGEAFAALRLIVIIFKLLLLAVLLNRFILLKSSVLQLLVDPVASVYVQVFI